MEALSYVFICICKWHDKGEELDTCLFRRRYAVSIVLGFKGKFNDQPNPISELFKSTQYWMFNSLFMLHMRLSIRKNEVLN